MTTSKYCEAFSPDINNIANLVTLGNSFDDSKNDLNVSANSDKETLEETCNHPSLEKPSNAVTLLDGRYDGKFVSPDVINLSKDEISLLSKGLKFIPTPKHINKVFIKEELETYGRKLRLMWHYRNEEQEIKKKSKFNPKRKDTAIEIYLSCLEEEIFSLDKKLSYSNLRKEERQAIYSLRDDTSIIIKEADKGSGIVVWDREDYLTEARTQLKDKDVYQELKGNIVGPLEKII